MHRHSRYRAAAGSLSLSLLLSACATGGMQLARPAPEALPAGSPLLSQTLGEGDAWLRHFITENKPDSAVLVLDSSRYAPKDELQHALQAAVVLQQAGRGEESNQAFEWAEREADERYTKSVSQAATSLIMNDGAMDFTPSRFELAMIPYYRIKNYLAAGDVQGSAVEARKASQYLAEIDGAHGEQCQGDAFLKYLTGIVYENAGEREDAAVALRQADAAFTACTGVYQIQAPRFVGTDLVRAASTAGLSDVAAEVKKRYGISGKTSDKAGHLVLVVENGFVAHRVSQNVHVPLFPVDVEGLDIKNPLAMFTAVGTISGRLINNLVEQGMWGAAVDDLAEVQWAQALDGAYIMKLSWPTYRLEANRASAVRVRAGEKSADAPVVADVSVGVARDFEEEKKLVLARAVARGITKYMATKAIESQAEKKGAAVGFLVGKLANLAGNLLEEADTRTWSLLPDEISIAHLELPAGDHPVQIELLSSDGSVAETIDLGTVSVEAGRHTIVMHRVWGDAAGASSRLARAAAGVEYKEPVKPEAEESRGDE